MSQANTPKIESNPPAAALPTPSTSTPAATPATPYSTAQWAQHRMAFALCISTHSDGLKRYQKYRLTRHYNNIQRNYSFTILLSRLLTSTQVVVLPISTFTLSPSLLRPLPAIHPTASGHTTTTNGRRSRRSTSDPTYTDRRTGDGGTSDTKSDTKPKPTRHG